MVRTELDMILNVGSCLASDVHSLSQFICVEESYIVQLHRCKCRSLGESYPRWRVSVRQNSRRDCENLSIIV